MTLRRLGWLGAVMLLGAALLIPGSVAAAYGSPKCGCSHTSTSTSTSTSSSSTSTETSDVSETTSTKDESTTTSTVDTSTTDQTTTTETSDVSETTSTQITETTTSDGTSQSETGGVGGETGTPDVTPPSTSSLPGSSGSSDGWRVILLVLAGIAVLSLILLPGDRKSNQR